MWNDLVAALALVLVIEGILPFLNPDASRRMFLAASHLDGTTLRVIGFASMCAGLLILYFVR